MSPELSIIIVQYKTPELLERCIASVCKYADDISLEIIVVNNDPEDTSGTIFTSKFPQVKWIDAGYNAGFSRANNIGMRNASGEYILILNPDTEIKEGFLRHYLSFYRSKDSNGWLGLLGSRIISSVDRSLLIGSGRGFPSLNKIIKINPIYHYLTRSRPVARQYDPYVMHYTNHEIDFVSGACTLIKRDKIIQDNLFFDEDFFLYFEDVEWAHRIQRAGFTNYFCGEIEVYHVNSASTGHSKGKFFQMQISGYLYYLKAYGLFAYLLIGFLLFSNFMLNTYLLKRAGQLDLHAREQEQYDVFRKYFWAVLRDYYFSSKHDKTYLKYA